MKLKHIKFQFNLNKNMFQDQMYIQLLNINKKQLHNLELFNQKSLKINYLLNINKLCFLLKLLLLIYHQLDHHQPPN